MAILSTLSIKGGNLTIFKSVFGMIPKYSLNMKTCLVFLFVIVALASANVSCPPVDNEHGEAVVFPHESDCSKFYLCSNGVPWEISCDEGLYFNVETNVSKT